MPIKVITISGYGWRMVTLCGVHCIGTRTPLNYALKKVVITVYATKIVAGKKEQKNGDIFLLSIIIPKEGEFLTLFLSVLTCHEDTAKNRQEVFFFPIYRVFFYLQPWRPCKKELFLTLQTERVSEWLSQSWFKPRSLRKVKSRPLAES